MQPQKIHGLDHSAFGFPVVGQTVVRIFFLLRVFFIRLRFPPLLILLGAREEAVMNVVHFGTEYPELGQHDNREDQPQKEYQNFNSSEHKLKRFRQPDRTGRQSHGLLWTVNQGWGCHLNWR